MSSSIKSINQLAARVAQDPSFAAEFQNNPVRTVTDIAASQSVPDTFVYRIVVLALGLALLVSLCGLIFLSLRSIENIPDGLVAIGSAAVGALAGLLAPSPSNT